MVARVAIVDCFRLYLDRCNKVSQRYSESIIDFEFRDRLLDLQVLATCPYFVATVYYYCTVLRL